MTTVIPVVAVLAVLAAVKTLERRLAPVVVQAAIAV